MASCNTRHRIPALLRLVAMALLLPSLQLAQAAEAAYQDGDPQVCLGCHGAAGASPAADILKTPHADKSSPHTPFSQQGCQSCHGPSVQHLQFGDDGKQPAPAVTFGSATPVAEQNAVCMACHTDSERGHWPGSTHEFEGLSCASCHTLHAEEDPVLQKTGQTGVCLDCHRDQRAEIHKPSTHPIAEGLMQCSDCHNSHGSMGEGLLKQSSANETCFECHAEKRGPFLWEHAPVTEDCSNCHNPHGSIHRPMLTGATPWLCQQCHMAGFHPSNVYSGNSVPPFGSSSSVLYRDCMNCHTQIHGSNHPSGVRITR